jgi:hypothetical protein
LSSVGASLAVSSWVPKGKVLSTEARPAWLSSLATAGTGARGAALAAGAEAGDEAALGEDVGEDLGAAGARDAWGPCGIAGPRAICGSFGSEPAPSSSARLERRGAGGGPAVRTAPGTLLVLGSGALEVRTGGGGGTERCSGRGAPVLGFFGELGSSAMAGIES